MHAEEKPPVMVQTIAGVAGFAKNSITRALQSRGVKLFRLNDQPNAPWFISASDAEEFLERVTRERELRPSRVDNDLRALKAVWRRSAKGTRSAFMAFVSGGGE